jgi:hypothetical protein
MVPRPWPGLACTRNLSGSGDRLRDVELGLAVDGVLDDGPLGRAEEDLGVVLGALDGARSVHEILDDSPLSGAEEDLDIAPPQPLVL